MRPAPYIPKFTSQVHALYYYLRYKIVAYFYYFYFSQRSFGSTVGQDQAFWTTNAVKQDFEDQYMSDWSSSYYTITNTDEYKGHKKEHTVKKYNKN